MFPADQLNLVVHETPTQSINNDYLVLTSTDWGLFMCVHVTHRWSLVSLNAMYPWVTLHALCITQRGIIHIAYQEFWCDN